MSTQRLTTSPSARLGADPGSFSDIDSEGQTEYEGITSKSRYRSDVLPRHLRENANTLHRQFRSSPALNLENIPPQRPGPNPLGSDTLKKKSSALKGSGDGDLSHVEVPRKFGEAAEYWKYYDELADRYDKDMMKILNSNLDILLIFVSNSAQSAIQECFYLRVRLLFPDRLVCFPRSTRRLLLSP